MSLQRIVIDSPEAAATIAEAMSSDADSKVAAERLENYVVALNSGSKEAKMFVNTGAVRATATITFSSRPTEDETLSLLNTTLTAKDSGANGTTQFNTAVSNTTTATNLAACINANTTLNKQVSATSALGVVTITVTVPGVVGNGAQISESMTGTAATAFASGSEGTSTSHSYGYTPS